MLTAAAAAAEADSQTLDIAEGLGTKQGYIAQVRNFPLSCRSADRMLSSLSATLAIQSRPFCMRKHGEQAALTTAISLARQLI